MLWFKKKDPVCGMKQEKGIGIKKHGQWFCAEPCLETYEKKVKKSSKNKSGCCH